MKTFVLPPHAGRTVVAAIAMYIASMSSSILAGGFGGGLIDKGNDTINKGKDYLNDGYGKLSDAFKDRAKQLAESGQRLAPLMETQGHQVAQILKRLFMIERSVRFWRSRSMILSSPVKTTLLPDN